MADVFTVNRALINAGTLPLPQGEYGGELKILKDTYTVVGVVGIGSTIKGVKLPSGAIVIGVKIKWEDMGASAITCKVGDGVDDDRYYATGTVDMATAGVIDNILQGGIGHKVGVPDSTTGIEADDKEIILTTEAGVMEVGQTFKMIVSYI